MKSTSATIKTKKLLRHCVVCSKDINVILYPDRRYKGGYYFFKMRIKNKMAEYWECNKCFKNQN